MRKSLDYWTGLRATSWRSLHLVASACRRLAETALTISACAVGISGPETASAQQARNYLVCVVHLARDQINFVSDFRDLPGGRVLIGARDGLFRFDPASGTAAVVESPPTGRVFRFRDLLGGGVLIGAENGLFRYDTANGTAVAVESPPTRRAIHFRDLLGGGVLIGAENGLFRYEPANGTAVAVEDAATGGVFNLHNLPDDGVLIGAENGLFRYDTANGTAVAVKDHATGSNVVGSRFAFRGFPGGGVLISGGTGLLRFDAANGTAVAVEGPTTRSYFGFYDLPDGSVLISAENGIFRFDPTSGAAVAEESFAAAVVFGRYDLSGSGELIGTKIGLFHFDLTSSMAVPVQSPAMGAVYNLHDLSGGGVLIGANNGLFRYETANGTATAVDSPGTGRVYGFHDLPYGNVLISAENGIFRFDPASGAAVAVEGSAAGGVSTLHNLPGDGVLIGAENGLFFVPLKEAKISALDEYAVLTASSEEKVVGVNFEHPCAPVADAIGLQMVIAPEGSESDAQPMPVRRSPRFSSTATQAHLLASASLKASGPWTVTLYQGDTPMSKRVTINVTGQNPIEWLQENGKQIAYVVALIYFAVSFVLLYAAHRSLRASRILMDPVWEKALVWPYFLLRQSYTAQLWVLEPWFQAVRLDLKERHAKEQLKFVDPPVTGPDNEELLASSLLSQLSGQGRIWLQGRTGMGKSMIFSEWEDSYFTDPSHPTLASAAKAFGFVLVSLRVRDYAGIKVPDEKNPESWIIEVFRRRLEESGLLIENDKTLKAILRSGCFVLAFDGTNEAEQTDAIPIFARQFRDVKIIATSQSSAPTKAPGDAGVTWKTWTLPPEISALRGRLLHLWLGETAGETLDHRLAELDRRLIEEGVEKGLTEVVASGYDLRLVADLANRDSVGMALPKTHADLYRMVLGKALRADGRQADLGPLRQLAFKMMLGGRREFSDEEAGRLEAGLMDVLKQDGVRIVTPKLDKGWAFRHDQMRAFLAAFHLAEDSPTLLQMTERIEKEELFARPRGDQRELWSFVAALLENDQIPALWSYAMEEPGDRGLLQAALQREADLRKQEMFWPTKR